MLNKFQEVERLFERADEHLEWLRKNVKHPDSDLFIEKKGYIMLEESGDIFTGKVCVILGEFASCLRNALNYLTCTLAKQDSGSLGNSVQFPLESSPKGFADNRNRFLAGIADIHLAFFEQYQPYKAGKPFDLLRELTNAYRHRELIQVKKKAHMTSTPLAPTQTHVTSGGHTVNVDFFDIAISLADGSPIVQTLEEIQRRVRQVVVEFKEPLAKYLSTTI